MARTIGRKYKNEVYRLAREAQGQTGLNGHCEIAQYVIDHMPEEAFDTWESAYSEIYRLASDFVFDGGR